MLKSVLSAALVFSADRTALVFGAALDGESSQGTPVKSCALLQTHAAHETKQKVELHQAGPCLKAFKIKVTACTKDDMIEALVKEMADVPACEKVLPQAELAAHLGSSDVDGAIRELCASYRAFPFGRITRQGDRFDKTFFDGGTWLNTEVQTNDGKHDLREEGGFIKGIFEKAQNAPFSWPDHLPNFQECDIHAVMCCHVGDRQAGDNNGNCDTPYEEECVDADPGDNTDVCYVDMRSSPGTAGVQGGFAVFPDDVEGDVHCHGFAWGTDENDVNNRYKGNMLFYASFYDHLYQRGYVKNIPGAPMCGCIEQMPVVSRADCTDIAVDELWQIRSGPEGVKAILLDTNIDFNACSGADGENNDLESFYLRLVREGRANEAELETLRTRLVGDCDGPIEDVVDHLH